MLKGVEDNYIKPHYSALPSVPSLAQKMHSHRTCVEMGYQAKCAYRCTVLRFAPTAAMMPATSPPGSPGSLPGYIPRTFSTSRKFSPIALTVSNTCA